MEPSITPVETYFKENELFTVKFKSSDVEQLFENYKRIKKEEKEIITLNGKRYKLIED